MFEICLPDTFNAFMPVNSGFASERLSSKCMALIACFFYIDRLSEYTFKQNFFCITAT